MTGLFWTDERVAEMKRLLKDGLSASQVATRIGCTRNAVIGKAHRIRAVFGVNPKPARKPALVSVRPAVIKRPYVRRLGAPSLAGVAKAPASLPPRIEVSGAVAKPAPQPRPVADTSKACGLLDLTGCKWPVGYDESVIGRHLFCNAGKHDESYCAAHAVESVAEHSRDLIRRTIKSVKYTLNRRAA